MGLVKLDAELRKEVGKGAVRKLRVIGVIPAVVYGEGKEAISLKLDGKELHRALHTSAGENVIIDLQVKSDVKQKERTVIIKEIQYDPIKGDVLHVDFNQISLTEVLKVKVPVVAKGEAVGVKQDGGVLEHILWELEVECLPTQIPTGIDVDVSALKIGDSIFVKNIKTPDGVKILNDSEQIVISCTPPMKEEVLAVAPEAEATEPEVLKQKTPEEIEAETAQAEAKEKEKVKEKVKEKGKEEKEK